MRARHRIGIFAVSALIMIQSMWCTTTQAGRHTFAVGDKMPEFSGTTSEGRAFTYKHDQKKALMVVFLSGGNKLSVRAASDVKEIMLQLGTNAERLEIAIAVDDPNGVDFSSIQKDHAQNFHVLPDSQYKLWGRFGIIATPTVVISDTNDNVLCIKAGHGHDFIPVIRAYLSQALGLAQTENPEDAGRVKTIANDTTIARLKRHLQMAKMLEQKGRFESAVAEIQKARQLDPNSAEAVLELGELFCRAGRSKEAIETIDSLKVTTRLDEARLLLISGWAKRQMGELGSAEKLLLEATTLDPISARSLFELGKVYQAGQQIDKAMNSYRKALTIIFNEKEPALNSH